MTEPLIRGEGFQKYRNPDPACTYPFTPDPVGYCCSFACHVDGGDEKFADMNKICPGCEMWKPKPPLIQGGQGHDNYDPWPEQPETVAF